MTFQNPGKSEITALLTSARTIAVVGLSDNPMRPSFDVAETLAGYGYEIVPVNPSLDRWQDIEARRHEQMSQSRTDASGMNPSGARSEKQEEGVSR